jgi:hypothetical protein
MPIQISCGSYHNIILSRVHPKHDAPSLDNQIITSYGLQGEAGSSGGQQERRQGAQEVAYEHREDDCPNVENMKKLKSEIKRLRQELIMKPSSKTKKSDDHESDDLEEGFSEEEK